MFTNSSIEKGGVVTEPMDKTLYSQCRGPRLYPWPRNYIPPTIIKTQRSQINEFKKKKKENMRGEGGLGYNFRAITLSYGGEGLSAQFGELESGVSKFP